MKKLIIAVFFMGVATGVITAEHIHGGTGSHHAGGDCY